MREFKIKDKVKLAGLEPGHGDYLNGEIGVVVGVDDHGGCDLPPFYSILLKSGDIISTVADYMFPWYEMTPPTSRGDTDTKVTWREFEEATKIPRMLIQIGPRSRY